MDTTTKFAKLIRIVTIAPLMALAALSILYVFEKDLFQNGIQFVFSLIFLVVLPTLGYPLQPYIPGFRDKGREGQRNLAIAMGVLGYILGIGFALFSNAPQGIAMIYWIYFISGVGIVIFNKLLNTRASGHACGVVGPIAFLMYFIGTQAIIGVLLIGLVYWASLKMKRHSVRELFWGSLIPIISLCLTILFAG